ncbi:MAG: UDP-N-acetylenolpyruvoylglucosamine reductase [Porticoccaceae bacterium]|nr:MAG: UDP-N-acetylenolpyruvoylglucosamine reductase [Porticoccaceae bacterium]
MTCAEGRLAIATDVSLEGANTLRLPARADYFCRVATLGALREALAFAAARDLPITVLGAGSNTVFLSRVPGLVIQMANRGRERVDGDGDSLVLAVAAGESWANLVEETLAEGWYGLENLTAIPGTVGAAPIQNIGAYGVELADRLVGVEVVDVASGRLRFLPAAACGLAYRDSLFRRELRGRTVIWRVFLRLSRTPAVNLSHPEVAAALAGRPADPRAVARAVAALRRAKLPDPAELPNAGSFFKNPLLDERQAALLARRWPGLPRFPTGDGRVKVPAAWLLDRLGWKGRRCGSYAVHDRQPLVLVHLGGGTGEGLVAFAAELAADVEARCGVALELEAVPVGVGDSGDAR